MNDAENAKDPKTMSSSALLRRAANGKENEYGYRSARGKLFCLLLGEDAYTVHTDEERRALRSLADKIDDERAAAYSDGFFAGKNAANRSLECDLAAAKSWPARKEDETIREYISRCFLPLPRYEDGEPVRPCDEWKAILMSLDGARFQLLEDYPDGLCFTGDLVKRPAPEELAADGLPIKVDETVFFVNSGNERVVKALIRRDDGGCDIQFTNGLYCTDSGQLTHTPPDTLERLRDDIAEWRADCAKPGSGWDVKTAEWADRIDAIIRRKGGAE